ncbi:T6SS immunity protein Tli4 family protein [Massilia sp. S19_KUP03_FR1]|uniref:T6SS immunity protein Tli4 family protein n=1 Tax=Massilia sp. S19_KUP03_FR1 TaxID=3025503 RepID=UPI002FCDD2B8
MLLSGREMKQHLRRTTVRVVLIVASAFGAVLWTVDAVWSMQEPKKVTDMSKHMKTVCVGRFLVDVPANAQVSLSRASVEGFDIVNLGAESREKFSARVAAREAEINARKNRAGKKNMVSVRDVRDEDVDGKVFVFDFSSGYLLEDGVKVVYSSVAVDGFAHVNDTTFRFHTNAYKPENAGKLEHLFKKLKPIGAGIVPVHPGFCLDGALLLDPLTADQGESIVMFAGLPGHEDLGIALATIAGKTPGPGLLERNAANRAGPYAFLNAFHSTLLDGHRTIDGMEGDELAFKVRERNFSTGYTFEWETQGTENDPLHPFVSLELQTGISPRAGGEPVQSTVSEESLGDLWRRMSSSLRLRPVEQPPAVMDADRQLGLALGTVAWAGAPCRQSGWWQCGEASADIGVFGGGRQFLREGAVMPQALLLPRPSIWQKVRRLQPSYETSTPTSWRLADKRRQPRRAPAAGLVQPTPSIAVPDEEMTIVAVGRIVRSAESCPASGWWGCVDADALDTTRWFARGVVLPPATYRLTGGGLKPRPGDEQLIVRQAGWQLMRLAQTVPQHAGPAPAGAGALV